MDWERFWVEHILINVFKIRPDIQMEFRNTYFDILHESDILMYDLDDINRRKDSSLRSEFNLGLYFMGANFW